MKNEPGRSSRRSVRGFPIKSPLAPSGISAALAALPSATVAQRQVLMIDLAVAGCRYDDGPEKLPELVLWTGLTLRAQPWLSNSVSNRNSDVSGNLIA